jgi:hypothetical protein
MPPLSKRITPRTLRPWFSLLAAGIASAGWAQSTSAPSRGTIVLAASVRDSINAIFVRFNEHWDELGQTNTLTQMLGTGHPTQHEYLGCLIGHTRGDTVWVTSWVPAEHLRQLQFAVAGDCDHAQQLLGTWHTHPFRGDPADSKKPLKEPTLSAVDLSTFAASHDRVTLAAWDRDSIDAAVRLEDGSVAHPAAVIVR